MPEPFSVEITRAVEDDLEDLQPYRDRVVHKLLDLELSPNVGHLLHGILRGWRSLEFSLPGGECRAVYKVLPEKRICLVSIVGYHEGFYERAERRLKALKKSGLIK